MFESVILSTLYRLLSSPTSLALILLALIPLYLIYTLYLSPLAHIPGPLTARLGLTLFRPLSARRATYVWDLEHLHRTYGPIVRTSYNHLSISSPSALPIIYRIPDPLAKTPFYHTFQARPGHPSLFSDTDVESHRQRKKAVAPAYAMGFLTKLEECVEGVISDLNERLREMVVGGTSEGTSGTGSEKEENKGVMVEFDKLVHYFAMDAVGELAFGKGFSLLSPSPSLSSLAHDPKSSSTTSTSNPDTDIFLQTVSNLSHYGSIGGSAPPWLGPRLNKFFRWSSARAQRIEDEKREQRQGRGRGGASSTSGSGSVGDKEKTAGPKGNEVIVHATRERVGARYDAVAAGEEVRKDMLDKFMNAKHSTTGELYTPNDVLFTATSVIAAGSDTTAVGLSALFAFLTGNARVYRKLQDEIDKSFDNGTLTIPIAYARAAQLPYLQACIKESLRLHPPISMDLPRLVPPGGLILCDRHVPEGTSVGMSPYIVHRQVEAFGEDAGVFRPERWIEADEAAEVGGGKGEGAGGDGGEARRRLEKYYFVFGGSTTSCIGKNISLMEISKLVPQLLHNFTFHRIPRSPTSPHRLPPRNRDGKVLESEGEGGEAPFWCDSHWFLETKDLWLRVAERVQKEI